LNGLEMIYMSDRIFVDTNILIDAHDISAGFKHRIAKDLLVELWENGQGCLSNQVLQEFFVTVTRKVSNPLEVPLAKKVITSLSHWTLHEPRKDDVLIAIDIRQRYLISFWDAMMINNAQQLKCDILWSEDLNQGHLLGNIKLVNPFQ
jgi:predicted nucleic acid-binding protein